MFPLKRILIPLGVGLTGAILLSVVYFGIVSLAESPKHALDLFWEDRWIIISIIAGFGIQAALYTVLKLRLFVPVSGAGPSGAMIGQAVLHQRSPWQTAAPTLLQTFCRF